MSKQGKGKTIVIAVVVILLFGLYLTFSLLQGGSTYNNVEASEAKNLILNTEELALIDVRELFEYEEGHIPGSRLIPLGELSSRLKELDPEKPILLICRSGNRSSQAAELLVKSGFKRVYNLAGGMIEWPYEVE